MSRQHSRKKARAKPLTVVGNEVAPEKVWSCPAPMQSSSDRNAAMYDAPRDPAPEAATVSGTHGERVPGQVNFKFARALHARGPRAS